MPSKCFASWASPNWTRPPRRRDKNRSCSDQPQNPPPSLLRVTGHNVKHALDANYGSLEAFTRAFRKAFRISPSLYRRMRDPHFHLPASNKIHFFAPGSSTKGGRDMDLFDRFAGNDSWHTRRLLVYAGTLTDEQLDRPLPTVVEMLPWRESNKTLRQLLENIIFTKEVW